MSVGPVSGNGIAITLPPGKIAFWSVTVQAAGNQFAQLKDAGGNVVFTATGASSGGAPTQIGKGSFTVGGNGNYKIYIGTNSGQKWSQVLWDDMSVNSLTRLFCSNFNFISEDAGDQDFNDSYVSLTWFDRAG